MKAGPWFEALYDGECAEGGENFTAGDEIRADGYGAWECRNCIDDDA